MAVLLVRHALPVVSAARSPGEWPLSASGRAEATALGARLASFIGARPAKVIASSERKAIETAELLGLGPVDVDPRVCEVEKPWYDDAEAHRDAAHRYLAGSSLHGWESSRVAASRFGAAIGDVLSDLAVVVSHGTVMSLWLADCLPEVDPIQYWSGLEMPDAWLVDLGKASLERFDATY